jgi:Protein of unknown function (DUF1194)
MRKTLLCMASAWMAIAAAPSQSSACVDVALVLAVDGSDSINDEEYAFQKSAIATAFRDKAVLSAMRDAGVVAISAVFWGDGEFPFQKLGWYVVDGGEEPSPSPAKLKPTSVPFSAIPIYATVSGGRWTCFPIANCAPARQLWTSQAMAWRRWVPNVPTWFLCIMRANAPYKWA